jgi:hypothetical protein
VDVVVTGLAALLALIGFTHCFLLPAGWWRDHFGRTGATTLDLSGPAPHPPDVLGGETEQVAASEWPGECHGSDRVLRHVGQPRSQGCLSW